jgi:small subunit ribosomal protein S2
MKMPSLEDLLAAGCHFGHLSSRWNPKMKPFIFTEKNGIHIINLKKTHDYLEKACQEIHRIAARGDSVLFVGTKKQAKDIVKSEALKSGNFFVAERWLGGQLTNFATIKRSIKKWKILEKKGTDGTYEKITKREILDIEREKVKMEKVFEGVAEMKRLPGAIFVIDTVKEHIAILEARKLNIPIFAIVDTNSDPDLINFPIPGNDDASKAVEVIIKAINETLIDGASKVKNKKQDEDEDQEGRPAPKGRFPVKKARPEETKKMIEDGN